MELACAPSDADIVYAIAADGSNVGWMAKTSVGDQASPTTWSTITAPKYKSQGTCVNSTSDFTRGQAWYDLIMAVHPTNSSSLMIGGIDLYRTTDGGSSFDLVSYWTGGCDTEVHADQHAIVFNPNSVNQVIYGNDGGVYYSSDATASDPTISARNNGYNVTQFYGAAIHPTSGTDHFLAGAQDNGSQSFTSSGMNSTTEVSGGDGAYCNIDQDEPTYQWTQYVYNSFFRSTDGGSSFSSISEFGSSSGRFINPSRYDDTNNIMYAAASTNQYLRWSNAQTGSTGTFVSVSSLGGGQISAIIVSPNTSNRLFVGTGASTTGGTPGGKVYVIDNAHSGSSVSATDISDSNFPSNGYVSCVEVENGDDNHILVTFSNYGVSSIWETTDGGTNWSEVEGDLPDMPVRWALFHPLDNTAAIIATELGVWTTNTLNGASTSWGPSNSGLSNVRTDMLQLRSSDNEVIAATHGRGLFSSSSFASAPTTNPLISFQSATTSDTETSEAAAGIGDCRPYKDHTITMNIANAPSGAATVPLSSGAGTTSSEWDDFVFTTNSDFTSGGKSSALTFANGVTTDKTFTIRVYDDATVESSEVIELEFSIAGTTDAAKAATKIVHTFTVTDNDEVPSFAGTATLLSEDFEGGALPSGWSTSEVITSANDWRIGTLNLLNGSYSAYVNWGSGGSPENYKDTDDAQTYLITPQIDATNYSDMTFSFNYQCNGEFSSSTYWDYGLIAYSTDGTNFTQLGSDYFQGVTTTTAYSITIPEALEGTTFYLAFYWEDDSNTGGQPAFVVDDVSVIATGTTIASSLNYTNEQYLGPNQTVLYFDDTNGELIAKIQNTSSHDYGCTSVTIDRAGTGTSEFWSATTSEYMMDKTVMITPTTNNINGTYTITLFYSSTEVSNWMTATSKSLTDLKLAKTSVAVSSITPSSSGSVTPELGASNTAAAFGTGYYITSSFSTGFSGIGAGDPGPPPVALPIEVINLKAELINKNDALISWTSMTEENTDYILIEHSTTGMQFETVGKIEAAGDSYEPIDYQFNHESINYGIHYYRLKTVDLDRQYEESRAVSVFQDKSTFELKAIYPVPAIDVVNLDFISDNNEDVTLSIIDSRGQTVLHRKLTGQLGANSSEVSCSDLQNGIYVIVLENNGRSVQKRLVVSK